ncbi:MAG: hypothetical protein ACSHW7_10675 [Patiriisocius sp.]|uniref:hypothetical protein n=1 Tax=Patiriisocius sp. TaxID=2822396 RepID=UPI003EF2B370
MKNINRLFSLAFAIAITSITFLSCEDEDKARIPELGNGGFVKFVTAPELNAGADPSTAIFIASVEDPNENVATYDIRVAANFTGATEDTISFRSTTTFPFDVGFTAADMATLFSVPVSTFEEGDSFEFFGTVTTVDGLVYDGTESGATTPTGVFPNSDEDGYPGEWNGGMTDGQVLGAPTLLQAFNWEVTFDDPIE